jgi:bifunctional pyridoxal-dependent enzyme with beta-cystathionase and maltose regulon repressor activities
METNRIVIDALKRAIEEWINTGSMSTDELNRAILNIEKQKYVYSNKSAETRRANF